MKLVILSLIGTAIPSIIGILVTKHFGCGAGFVAGITAVFLFFKTVDYFENLHDKP
jgi:hypothetical protein